MSTCSIGITCGDPNGIGPEIIAATETATLADATVTVYADPYVFEAYNLDLPDIIRLKNVAPGFKVQPGKCTAEGGRYAMLSLEAAVKDAKNGVINAIVTAPISKEAVNMAGWSIPGHTEWLAEQFNAEVLMILASPKLRVGLVTGHMPLHAVASRITQENVINTVQKMQKALRRDFQIKRPSVAVLGLNPHAGDGGVLGTEERDIITPAITKLNESGLLCSGPFAADGFFGNRMYEKYDGIVAMYHDQGLAPFKALSFGEGVNVTAGLPIVRTSPDHGTAFAIAGRKQADSSSFKAALQLAYTLCKNRLNQSS
jgi:4-hydroxythreonine-4-phosphate dehydrogenase